MEPAEEIKNMIDTLEGTKAEKVEEAKEEPKAEAQEQPKEEEVVEEKVEEVKVEPEGEPAPETPDYESENVRLRQMLNEIAKRVREPASTPPVVPVPSDEKPPTKADVDLVAEFVTQEEADNLIDKPLEVLTSVLKRFAKVMREDTLRTLPPIVGDVAQRHITMYEKVQSFYRDNKDLDEFRDFVGLVGTQIENEHPDWTVDQIYTETAKVARARLGLREAVQAKEASQESAVPTKTGLPGSHRASRKPSGGPQLTEDQQSMVELLNLDLR